MPLPPTWAWSQPALFETDEADTAFAMAVENAEAKADAAVWHEMALAAVKLIAEHRQEFTTDSVWAVLAHWGMGGQVDSPDERRAMGNIMRRAAKSGWAESTDQVQKSIRPDCHGRKLTVWKSNLVTDGTLSTTAN